MLYQACLLMILDGLISKFTSFSILEAISFDRSSRVIGQLNAAFIGLLLYPANHWYFVKNKGFDKLYEEYHHSDLNTKKNRVICAFILILGLIGLIIVAVISKGW